MPCGNHWILLVGLHRIESRGQRKGVQNDRNEDVQKDKVNQGLGTTRRIKTLIIMASSLFVFLA